MNGEPKPDYGIDSPAMVWGQLIIGLTAMILAIAKPRAFGLSVRWLEAGAAAYFLFGALSMFRYSRSGKLTLRKLLLDTIPWRGDETVLDVGCGRGLLLMGAARRLTTGKAIGVDIWLPHAITGNSPEAVLRNAAREGVADRVEVKRGDVRDLPFESGVFDVVISNFVVHEVNNGAEREKMLLEMVRVLKPGGRLALIDFIFTDECVQILKRAGLSSAMRTRIDGLGSRIASILMLGAFRLYRVNATKMPDLQ